MKSESKANLWTRKPQQWSRLEEDISRHLDGSIALFASKLQSTLTDDRSKVYAHEDARICVCRRNDAWRRTVARCCCSLVILCSIWSFKRNCAVGKTWFQTSLLSMSNSRLVKGHFEAVENSCLARSVCAKDVPHRVFAKGKEIPGLAMSRSIGDLAGHMAGVIHQSFPQWDHVPEDD